MVEPKLVTINPIEVLYVNSKGADIDSANSAWATMIAFLLKGNLLKDAICRYGIIHTDLSIDDDSIESYDACVEFNKTPLPSDEVLKKSIAGGNYACFLHKGDYKDIKNTFIEIRNWISKNKVTLRDTPHFQKYLDFDITGIKPEDLRTEIYVPIK
ncbi:MAG TPA: AraC family transcriptional regulator [Arcobacter sp.]|nr:AraC family transcriptional regulator [Arcobacter sp.]